MTRPSILLIIIATMFSSARSQQLGWLLQSGGQQMDLARDVAVSHLGNTYCVGSISPTGYVGEVHYESPFLALGNKGYVQKLNAGGALEWHCALDGNGSAECTNISLDAKEDIYVVGSFSGTIDFDPDTSRVFELESNGDFRLFVLKLNSQGDFQWVFTLDESQAYAEADIALDEVGNIYLGGLYNDPVDLDPGIDLALTSEWGSTDIFYAKYSREGKLLWYKTMGSDRNDALLEIIYDAHTNSLISTGYFRSHIDTNSLGESIGISSVDSWDVFVQKVDTAGVNLWTRSFGGLSIDVGQALDVDAEGNIYVGGAFMSKVDFDPGPDSFFIDANSSDPAGLFVNDDGFVQKLDPDGHFLWATGMLSQETGIVYDLVVSEEQLYVTGNFSDKLFLAPGTEAEIVIAGNETPFFTSFVASYDHAGSVIGAFALGGGDPSIDQRIEILGNDLILAGNFSETVFFLSDTPVVSRGILDAYVARILTNQSTAIHDASDRIWQIYPNPTKQRLWVNGHLDKSYERVQIFDLLGNLHVEQMNFVVGDHLVVADLVPGMYLLTLDDGQRKLIKRFIKY